jgi:hypothetical protein
MSPARLSSFFLNFYSSIVSHQQRSMDADRRQTETEEARQSVEFFFDHDEGKYGKIPRHPISNFMLRPRTRRNAFVGKSGGEILEICLEQRKRCCLVNPRCLLWILIDSIPSSNDLLPCLKARPSAAAFSMQNPAKVTENQSRWLPLIPKSITT